MAKTSILVVDDESAVMDVVSPTFDKAGYKLRWAKDADEAFACLKNDQYDMVLLDIELPGISGMKFLEILKQEPRTTTIPVIMLTAQGREASKVHGLKTGADDYLVKPFSPKELLARVEALLRRIHHGGRQVDIVEAGGLTVNFDAREVTAKGKRVLLTPTEFDLLSLFIKRKGSVLTYAALIDAISGGNSDITSESLYVHINNLRKKLGSQGKVIETIYGIGYKFAPN